MLEPSVTFQCSQKKQDRPLIALGKKRKNNSGMTLVVAVNYGSRQEIIQAVEKTAVQLAEKRDQGRRCSYRRDFSRAICIP